MPLRALFAFNRLAQGLNSRLQHLTAVKMAGALPAVHEGVMRSSKSVVAILIIAAFSSLAIGDNSSTQAQVASPENTQAANQSRVSGTIAAASLNACALLDEQYTLEVYKQDACGTTFHEIMVDTTPDVKLYVRYGQRVAVEDAQIIADYKDESSSPFKKVTLEPPYPGGTYYIALTNCAQTPESFEIYFGVAVVDYFGPFIKGVSLKGKKLKVTGCYFDIDAVIVVNGIEHPTVYSHNGDMPTLISKKAGKKISRGETVFIQVKNGSGLMSQVYTFTRGAE